MAVQLDVEERRRSAILAAAGTLIAERGYHAVRIADIARLVGTSTGAVHYYFPGKNDVLTAALRHALEQAFQRQRVELVQIEDAHQRLLRLIDMQLPTVGQGRDEWSVWLQFWAEAAIHPELRPVHNEFYDRWRDAVSRTVRRGQHQGVFCRNLDVDWVTLRLTALTDGAGIQVLTGAAGMTVTVMRELLVDFVERELLPTRATR
ncbi:MAG TPA: TetR family transcriptional regulator C-terminal domain-containing protein [Pseudonocardia sp.]|jgi:AcrR family transcriptional regulator|nr:TetR family transcriptional regulator C-terminal domain-containing protein [Pseudonocardia sp.]